VKAQTQKIERIFGQTIRYQVPLFQRPYVWSAERNWDPLWEDISSLLDKHIRGEKVRPHFLGAVVLEQVPQQTGGIESREVIDGQQRFTTLQLMLIAARDLAGIAASDKYSACFDSLVSNNRNLVNKDDEVLKLCPTNSDRLAFRLVHKASSPATLDLDAAEYPELDRTSTKILDCYKYFYGKFEEWLSGVLDDEDHAALLATKSTEDRLAVAWEVVRNALQLVVIDLEEDDETQVIFETLNARGEDLLPADLIKNYLFRKATAESEAVLELYEKYWKAFEDRWWRTVVKQGRLIRPRIDIFFNYYLSMMTRDDVRSGHLFQAFKSFAESESDLPLSAASQIQEIARYAKVFRELQPDNKSKRLAIFLRRMDAVDTTTVFPFLLYAYGALVPSKHEEFEMITGVIESYLMRRLLCGMTAKNYNRIFVELIKAVDKTGAVSAQAVRDHLSKASGDSSLFPTDDNVKKVITGERLYGRLSQKKVRCVMEALDMHAEHAKSEPQLLPDNLTIEHVMPQSWQDNWPIPAEVLKDGNGAITEMSTAIAKERRERLINTIGNLTLITSSLNPALSNGAWSEKKPELLAFSRLNLTRYFHSEAAQNWTEKEIQLRTQSLCEQLLEIWPGV